MDTQVKTWLTEQLNHFTNAGITVHSIALFPQTDDDGQLIFDKYNNLKKKPDQRTIPSYQNKKIDTFISNHLNASIAPMGDVYNLIGIDVDNKNDSVDKYWDLAIENSVELDTFTVETMNNGIHFYYRPTKKQTKVLKNLTSLDASNMFGLDIDVKYNNQVLWGAGVSRRHTNTLSSTTVIQQNCLISCLMSLSVNGQPSRMERVLISQPNLRNKRQLQPKKSYQTYLNPITSLMKRN